jgi:hypothetical protein
MSNIGKIMHAKEWSEVDHSKPLPSGVYIIRATDRPHYEKQLAPILRFPDRRADDKADDEK